LFGISPPHYQDDIAFDQQSAEIKLDVCLCATCCDKVLFHKYVQIAISIFPGIFSHFDLANAIGAVETPYCGDETPMLMPICVIPRLQSCNHTAPYARAGWTRFLSWHRNSTPRNASLLLHANVFTFSCAEPKAHQHQMQASCTCLACSHFNGECYPCTFFACKSMHPVFRCLQRSVVRASRYRCVAFHLSRFIPAGWAVFQHLLSVSALQGPLMIIVRLFPFPVMFLQLFLSALAIVTINFFVTGF